MSHRRCNRNTPTFTDTRGFDTYAWDDGLYDRETEVDNFVGIFSESASEM